MGYENEYAAVETPVPPIIFDIETVALDDAAEFIVPPSAPAHYKDPEKIAAYVAEATAKEVRRAALDVDLCRVVCIGLHSGDDAIGDTVLPCLSPDLEAEAIRAFWAIVGTRLVCGFNCLGFDLPVLLRRSLYLGVPAPAIDLSKYRHPQVIDLMQMLSFNGLLQPRGLSFYAKRLGIAVDDPYSGKDIADLAAANDSAAIQLHCLADVAKTRALAQRLGVA